MSGRLCIESHKICEFCSNLFSMRILLSIVLSTLVLSSSVMNALALLDYASRYDHYAEVLCENKDKPNLACHGSCQLVLNDSKDQLDDSQEPELRVLELNYMPSVQDDRGTTIHQKQIQHQTLWITSIVDEPLNIPEKQPPRV